jgi:fucose permease
MTVEELDFVGINILGAAWGFFAFPMYAIAVAHANDYADADDYVMVSSGLLMMFGAGAIIGPFMASAIMTLTDASGLYLLTMLVHASLAVYVLLRIFRRSSAPTEQHIAFSDALATAHTVSQIYEEEMHYQEDHEENGDSG